MGATECVCGGAQAHTGLRTEGTYCKYILGLTLGVFLNTYSFKIKLQKLSKSLFWLCVILRCARLQP